MSRLDDTFEPKGGAVRRIELITGGGERRRRWSDKEKAEAIEESLKPGAVVSEVARRRGLTPQQLFAWRRAARRQAAMSDAAPFAPVVVAPVEGASAALTSDSKLTTARLQPLRHVIELDIDGANVWIWRDAPVEMVRAIIGALKAGS